MSCKHATFVPRVTMNKLSSKEFGVSVLIASVTATCSDCGRPFTWRAPSGLNTEGPGTDAAAVVLRVPVDYPAIDEDSPEPPGDPEPVIH